MYKDFNLCDSPLERGDKGCVHNAITHPQPLLLEGRVKVAAKGNLIYFSCFTASIGGVFVAKSLRGVCRISFPCATEKDFFSRFSRETDFQFLQDDTLLQYETALLKDYFLGKLVTFDFTLDFDQGTPFQVKVWKKLMEIPYGEYRSYKWVAEEIGQHKAARAVGMANNKNPLPPVVPCHRVIGSDGGLTGYASGLAIKKQLLEMEHTTLIQKLGLL
jgi:O-6-methylguanine DNA methyltransferase